MKDLGCYTDLQRQLVLKRLLKLTHGLVPPSRANQTYPDPQQTLPFLTLKGKALKSLMLLILGGKN
eukprot:791814-Pelagomonas_calceolata.AAC.1